MSLGSILSYGTLELHVNLVIIDQLHSLYCLCFIRVLATIFREPVRVFGGVVAASHLCPDLRLEVSSQRKLEFSSSSAQFLLVRRQ